jgi:hypothetical protein
MSTLHPLPPRQLVSSLASLLPPASAQPFRVEHGVRRRPWRSGCRESDGGRQGAAADTLEVGDAGAWAAGAGARVSTGADASDAGDAAAPAAAAAAKDRRCDAAVDAAAAAVAAAAGGR